MCMYSYIALVTAVSKLFNLYLRCFRDLPLNTRLSGFKSKYSTDLCNFTAKSLTKYCTDQNTPVCTCLLDVSKAFA